MSFFKQFILDLQELLKVNVPEIRFIDQNLGQWGEENFGTRVSFPALLVDFPTTSYSDVTNGQLCATEVKFTLLFSTMSQSSNLQPAMVKNNALEYYVIEKKLTAFLGNWQTDYFSPLTRVTAVSRNQNELGLRIREISYSTQFEEWLDDQEQVEYTLQITGEILETDPTD